MRDPSANVDICRVGYAEQYRIIAHGIAHAVKMNGCTLAPDFDFGAICCNVHDVRYELQDVTRKEADWEMRECIRSYVGPDGKTNYALVANVYYAFVRAFGWIWWNRQKRRLARGGENGNGESVSPAGYLAGLNRDIGGCAAVAVRNAIRDAGTDADGSGGDDGIAGAGFGAGQ